LSKFNLPERKSSHRLSRSEMRNSLLIPTAFGLLILLVGVVAAMLAPGAFIEILTVAIGAGLLVYLLITTRRASRRLRITAVVLAIPALVGVTLGLISGSARDPLIGIGVTFGLLVLLRLFSTPISFRAAYNRFRRGDSAGALDLINRSISARPDFWESYQLRALIHLSNLSFQHAERDAIQALALKPDAHPVYNTLGQIYLAQERFDSAREAYTQAQAQAPNFALYDYHLGLSAYRLGEYRAAAEALAASTQGTLPLVEYDLQAHYYLLRCLEELGDEETAATVKAVLPKFKAGLAALREQLDQQPNFPHVARLRADLDAMTDLLAALPDPED